MKCGTCCFWRPVEALDGTQDEGACIGFVVLWGATQAERRHHQADPASPAVAGSRGCHRGSFVLQVAERPGVGHG